ncbi:IS3 family transposase [Ligilactobacillus equi]|uniref:IS3 family transposase n=1 Tax=Ligilactobacillus equi TaxID=137357 RepID=UPI0039BD6B21
MKLYKKRSHCKATSEESFFHLFKVESLYGFDAPANLSELKELFFGYADWYNNGRISIKTKGMTPIVFRNHAPAG